MLIALCCWTSLLRVDWWQAIQSHSARESTGPAWLTKSSSRPRKAPRNSTRVFCVHRGDTVSEWSSKVVNWMRHLSRAARARNVSHPGQFRSVSDTRLSKLIIFASDAVTGTWERTSVRMSGKTRGDNRWSGPRSPWTRKFCAAVSS